MSRQDSPEASFSPGNGVDQCLSLKPGEMIDLGGYIIILINENDKIKLYGEHR